MAKLRNPDRDEIEKLMKALAQKLGHEAVRELYAAHKKIRKVLGLKHLSLHSLLKASLFDLFANEYSNIELKNIAKIEGISIGIIYKLKNEFYQEKGRS